MKRSKVKLIGFSVILIIILIIAFTPPGIEAHETKRLMNAPHGIVWSVIADIENYHKYATGLTEVKIISGKGEGMVRACSDAISTWTETCTKWVEGESYSFDVNTDTGFPFPFDIFNGTWSLEKQSEDETLIIVNFKYQFSYRWLKWFYNDDTYMAIDKGNTTLLNNWSKKIKEVAADQLSLSE